MSLTARLSAFFLGALALVLVGSGVALYVLTSTYLDRRDRERLSAALEAMSSAAEVGSRGIEWEPNKRDMTLGQDTAEDQVRWTVHEGSGRLIAESANLAGADLSEKERWRTLSRIISCPTWSASPPSARGAAIKRYERLILTAGVSPRPAQVALARLGEALVGVGIGAWLLAAVVGHYIGRRVLAPVRRMAAAAAAMSAADLGHRLALTGTGDELDELGAAFNGLLERLEEAFERQRRFSGDAAHQLCTPLTILLGQLEVALRRERSALEYRSAMIEAHSQALLLRQIVELLLFLARPDADAALPARESVHPAEWLADQLAQWRNHARSADFDLELGEGIPATIEVAPALLRQLLDNLLDNACKYSPTGSPIRIVLERSPDGLLLAVEDAGTGISPDDLGRIFEPFYRSAEARRLGKSGIGLGLAVARRIACSLGGWLTVQSQPGQGSRFVLSIPVVATELPSTEPVATGASQHPLTADV